MTAARGGPRAGALALAVAAPVLAALLCAGPVGAAGAQGAWPEDGQADLRIVGASPALDGVAAAVDGQVVADALAFGTATAALPVTPGRHEVTVGRTVATVEVTAGCTTNVVAAERPVGAAPALVAVPGCAGGRIPDGAARLTLLVASDEPGTVRVTAGEATPVEVAPFTVSAPLHPAAGETTVALADAASGAPYTSVPAELAPGTATLAVFAGGGDTPFRLFGVFDGTQAIDPPARGEIHTGPPASGAAWPAVVAGTLAGGVVLVLASTRRCHGTRRGAAGVTALALAVAVLGAGGCTEDEQTDAGPPGRAEAPVSSGPADRETTTARHGAAERGPAVVTASPRSAPAPARLLIPDLGVDAQVVPLDVGQADDLVRTLQPEDVGWFRGTAPGTLGVATLAGHTGPRGVFGRLAELGAGVEVLVVDGDGGLHRFLTRSSAAYRKGAIPAASWGPTRAPVLALVSCTGPRRGDGLHRDNLIVWASAAA